MDGSIPGEYLRTVWEIAKIGASNVFIVHSVKVKLVGM